MRNILATTGLVYQVLATTVILWAIPFILLPRRQLNRHLVEGMAVLTCEWVGFALFHWHPNGIVALANFLFICRCCVKSQEAIYGSRR